MYNKIIQIENKVANIGGDYFYVPDDGTGELVDSFVVNSAQSWSFLGQLFPRYNGMVTIKNKNQYNTIIPIDLFSAFSNYQYGSGTNINNIQIASYILGKKQVTQSGVLNTFYPVIGTNSQLIFPVIAGIPVFIYTYSNPNSLGTFDIEMRAKKIAK